jgi:leucyl aminopeptidase (aminopeptidase T)
MQQVFPRLFLLSLLASSLQLPAFGQESQSVGDVARQVRMQKENKDAQNQGTPRSKTPKVITNDEIPQSDAAEPAAESANDARPRTSAPADAGATKTSAEQWKSLIRAQKNLVSSLQGSIDTLNASIHFAPGNCVANCVQWNERQKQKQKDAERMRSDLDTQKKSLEKLQQSARQQGYGSSVYDP